MATDSAQISHNNLLAGCEAKLVLVCGKNTDLKA